MNKKVVIPPIVTASFIISILLIGIILQSALTSRVPGNKSLPKTVENHSLVDVQLDRMSLRDKVASLFIFHVAGTDGIHLKSFVDTYNPGGVILMNDNIPGSDEELRTITGLLQQGRAEFPLLIAIDQEGGSVSRLPGDTHPAGATLIGQPTNLTAEAFENRSNLVESVGINLNFGIVADTTDDSSSYIYPRVLGTTPHGASEHVASAVDATNGRTLSTIKHFPGHGETNDDSHFAVPATDTDYATWERGAMLPFQAGIDAGADMVMFSHLRYVVVDDAPASLSRKWHDILEGELKFDGVTITDDMFMLQNSGDPRYGDPVQNAISAVLAGNTLLLYVTQNGPLTDVDPDQLIDGVVAAVENNIISTQIIEKNARDAMNLRYNLRR